MPDQPQTPRRKRKRALKAKPGEIIAFYGYAEGEGPDICVAWGAAGGRKGDAHFLLDAFTKPFVAELKSRGYDLNTMKFSIRKTTPPGDPNP